MCSMVLVKGGHMAVSGGRTRRFNPSNLDGRKVHLNRRGFIVSSAAALVATIFSRGVRANVPVPYDADVAPPMDTRANFVDWMGKNRGEDPGFLGQRWDRFQQLLAHHDLWEERNMRAFLMTPREEFVTKRNLSVAYEWHHLDIGYGVTITGPHTVGRMTNTIDVQTGDKVLEIGTGSGYQSAYLSYLTNRIWSVEIIPALADRTRGIYDALIASGYVEYKSINTKNADGYYGWEENAPFDKIIVTCGIDHIPPPLLRQLKTGGIMVIPIGPPGAQHVLKVVKKQDPDGTFTVARSDIYGGSMIPFVPFTKLEGGVIKGTHNG
jgi:protein-L-isoaspartate(D-aspartate) O-methyltransferase